MTTPNVSSIQEQNPVVRYVAGAGQTIYVYPFTVFEDTDLKVTIDNVLLTLNVDYTITGVGAEDGGTIVLNTGTVGGEAITLYRDTPINRLNDYVDNGTFLAADVNNDFDRIILMLQEIVSGESGLGTSVRIPVEDIPTDLLTVLPVIRENSFLKFGENKELIAVPAGTGESPIVEIVTEKQTLANGQTTVDFSLINAGFSAFYIIGQDVDQGRLARDVDYELISDTRINLYESYPAGSIVLGVYNEPSDSIDLGQNVGDYTNWVFSTTANMQAGLTTENKTVIHRINQALQVNGQDGKYANYLTVSTPTPITLAGGLFAQLLAAEGGTANAEDIFYDNTSSGLAGSNVQDAIDETAGMISNPNLLINGDCTVNQREIGFDNPITGSDYFVDRYLSGSAVSDVGFYSASATPPGTNLYDIRVLRVDSGASVLGSQCDVAQLFERDQDLLKGGKYTFQFLGRCSADTSTVYVRFDNNDGSGNIDTVVSENLTLTPEFQTFSVTLDIPEFSGDINTFNHHKIRIDTTIDLLGFRDFTNWKFEKGAFATPFVPDDPQVNLAKCQRYFQKSYSDGELLSGKGRVDFNLNFATNERWATVGGDFTLQTAMRVNPLITTYNDLGEAGKITCEFDGGSVSNNENLSTISASNYRVNWYKNIAGNDWNAIRFHYTAAAEL